MTAAPPVQPTSPDWTIDQGWEGYSAADHGVWQALFRRQMAMLPGRATRAFLDGVQLLALEDDAIPDFRRLSERLMRLTGWQVVAVPGLVPDEVFFEHLANRRFVSGNFIRRPDQLDYLQEPDVFHDVFGHVPMLAHPVFADYLQAYGQGGLRAAGKGVLERLARLYWYTVEFGLIEEEGALRLYGSGIVSSHGESRFALDSSSPNRLGFDLKRLMRTPYRIDDYQQVYFVVRSFDELLEATLHTDFGPVYASLEGLADHPIDAILPEDDIWHRGNQSHEAAGQLRSA